MILRCIRTCTPCPDPFMYLFDTLSLGLFMMLYIGIVLSFANPFLGLSTMCIYRYNLVSHDD